MNKNYTDDLLNQIFEKQKSCLLTLKKWQPGEMLMHWLLIEETEVTVLSKLEGAFMREALKTCKLKTLTPTYHNQTTSTQTLGINTMLNSRNTARVKPNNK